ncbi:PQQ-dependent sugar dehydrogenase [Nostocoides vanveenii]
MPCARLLPAALVALGVAACTPSSPTASPTVASSSMASSSTLPFRVTEIATYDEPWAMTFLPDSSRLLVTERDGALSIRNLDSGKRIEVSGTPKVVAEGQGGLGDVLVGPDFAKTQRVYLSWAEAGDGGTGAAVGRARLVLDGDRARLEGLTVIWRQQPKTSGSGHFGHRLAISPDKRFLFVTSGERQKFDPAQDLGTTLGKTVRLTLDGAPAPGNPFVDKGSPADEIYSYGHRNPLGIAFDAAGNLWESEMGPMGGDEINLIRAGANYGWPAASNGSHYSGQDIPDHRAGDGFEAPKVWWNPSISPGSLMIYSGPLFPQWRGDAFVGALSGQALIRVDLDETTATKGDQWPMNARIREVEQGPDGAIYLLQDGQGAHLLRVTPN